jgi:hypothetical protein
LRGITR